MDFSGAVSHSENFLKTGLDSNFYALEAWARGERANHSRSSGDARISVISALTLTPECQRVNLFFELSADHANFNGQSFAAFLRLLHARVKNPIPVIWDSVGIHLSQPVADDLSRNGNIVSEPFPPNAAELNPADGAGSHLKSGRLPNSTPFDLSELRRTITTELKRLQRQPHLLHAFIRRTRLSFEE